MDFSKKYFTSLSVVVLIVILGRLIVPKSSAKNIDFSTVPTTETSLPVNDTTPLTPANIGKYKNGTYTGPVVDAGYGNVQIKLTVAGGKITKIAILQYPNENGTSAEINSFAIPQLKSEVISAQSANIDAVSGASFTSQAFDQSVSSALNQAS